MSKLTCVILPATAGATSVCASLTRLPVASKYVGISRTIAGVVVTSTIVGWLFAFVFAWPDLQPDNAAKASANAVAVQNALVVLISKSLRLRRRGVLSSLTAFLQYR